MPHIFGMKSNEKQKLTENKKKTLFRLGKRENEYTKIYSMLKIP